MCRDNGSDVCDVVVVVDTWCVWYGVPMLCRCRIAVRATSSSSSPSFFIDSPVNIDAASLRSRPAVKSFDDGCASTITTRIDDDDPISVKQRANSVKNACVIELSGFTAISTSNTCGEGNDSFSVLNDEEESDGGSDDDMME